MNKYQDWRVYKPKKNGDGAATKIEYNPIIRAINVKSGDILTVREMQLFMVSARQKGFDKNNNAQFSWDDDNNYVTMKLGEPDVGNILAVLFGEKQNVGSGNFNSIYHENPKGSTSLTFESVGEKGFSLRLAKKIGDKVTDVKHYITLGEATILRVLLEQAIRSDYGWYK